MGARDRNDCEFAASAMVRIHYKWIDHPKWKYELQKSYTRLLVSAECYRAGQQFPVAWVFDQTWHGSDFLNLSVTAGLYPLLTSSAGYRWDGCSGPTVDTPTNMRAGLVHDSLYQLMRLGVLPQSARRFADREFLLIMKEDGMNWFRRTYYYLSVRLFARKYAKKV